jgi:DNA polymerase-3 subunit beta
VATRVLGYLPFLILPAQIALNRSHMRSPGVIGVSGGARYLYAILSVNLLAEEGMAKVVPANGSASETQAIGKRLKVTCGANTSYLEESAWIGTKTPMTICDVRISPSNAVKPNIGSIELSEALNRVLPYTATEENRPILHCVHFVAKEGKLTMVSADGFRLAEVTLDCDIEGEALISRVDLIGIASALRTARRANISFERKVESLDGSYLILDTELIRYKWTGVNGDFPDYEKLIPTTFNATAHFDTVEALKAVSSLKFLSDSNNYPIDLTIGDSKLSMSNPDSRGLAEMPADTQGEARIRLDGRYLTDALRACGGMADLSLVDEWSPMVITTDGYRVVTMPMPFRPKPQATTVEAVTPTAATEVEAPTSQEEKAEAVAEAEELTKSKPKRKHKAKEPVTL